jgi:hypothetical protein
MLKNVQLQIEKHQWKEIEVPYRGNLDNAPPEVQALSNAINHYLKEEDQVY